MKKTSMFHTFLAKIGLLDKADTAKPEDYGFNKYYTASEAEIKWAVDKIKAQQRRYESLLKLKGKGEMDSWKEFAALHYIAFRLNYARLDMLKPAPLGHYQDNYYYQAAMIILNRLNGGK